MWRSLQVAQIAGGPAGIECIIGSNLEWEVGSSAMLHLAVSIPNLSRSVGHDIIGPLDDEHQIAKEPIRIENGCAVLPKGNGLGVEVALTSIKEGKYPSATNRYNRLVLEDRARVPCDSVVVRYMMAENMTCLMEASAFSKREPLRFSILGPKSRGSSSRHGRSTRSLAVARRIYGRGERTPEGCHKRNGE